MSAHDAPALETHVAREQLRAIDDRRGRDVDTDLALCSEYGALAEHLDPRSYC